MAWVILHWQREIPSRYYVSFKKSFLITIVFNLVILGLDKGAGLIMYYILQEHPEDKGVLDILGQLPFVLMVIANLGLASSLVYYTRRKEVTIKTAGETTSFVALLWGSFVAILGLIGMAVWAWLQPDRLLPGWYLIVPLFFTTPLLLIISYRNSVLLVMDRIRVYNIVHLIPSILYLPVLLLFFFVLDEGAAVSVVWARVLPIAILALWLVWYLRRDIPPKPAFDSDYFSKAIGFGWRANINSVLSYLNHRLDIILLIGLFYVPTQAQIQLFMESHPLTGTPEAPTTLFSASAALVLREVAFYSLAVTLAELIWHFPEALRDLLFSRVAGSHPDEASEITPLVCRNSLLMTSLGAVAIWFVHDPFFRLLSGSNWEGIWQAKVSGSLAVLLPGAVCYTIAKVLQADLAGRGHIGTCIFLVASVFVIMVVGDGIFVPSGGARAAAAVSTVSYGVASLLSLAVYKRESGLPLNVILIPRPSDFMHYKELVQDLLSRIRKK